MIMYPQHRKLQITKPEATSEPASRGSYLWRCPGGHDCHLPTFPLSGPKHGTWQPAINVATETKTRKECPFTREEAENHWLMANLESETEMAQYRHGFEWNAMKFMITSCHVPFRHLGKVSHNFSSHFLAIFKILCHICCIRNFLSRKQTINSYPFEITSNLCLHQGRINMQRILQMSWSEPGLVDVEMLYQLYYWRLSWFFFKKVIFPVPPTDHVLA